MANIQQEKRLTATVAAIREGIKQGHVNSLSFVSGPVNLADTLTKATAGTQMYNLMTENLIPVVPFEELKRLWGSSSNKKQYIFEQLADIEYKRTPKIQHRTRFVEHRKKRRKLGRNLVKTKTKN